MRLCSNDWSLGPAADCRTFDFTLEFQYLFLVIVPALIYCSCASIVTLTLWKAPVILRNWSRWSSAMRIVLAVKLLADALLVLGSIISTVMWFTAGPAFQSWSAYFGQTVSICAALVICASSILQHFKNYRSDMTLALYLISVLFCDAAVIRSYYLIGIATSKMAIGLYLRLVASTLLLVIENVSKASIIERGANGKAIAVEASAPSINRLFFIWLDPLMFRGFRQPLNMDTLGDLDSALETAPLYAQSEAIWKSAVQSGCSNPLLVTIWRTFKWELIKPVVPNVLAALAKITSPLIIQAVLVFLTSYSDTSIEPQPAEFGYGLSAAYFLLLVIQALSFAQFNLSVNRSMAMIRGMLVEMIYRKTVRCHLFVVDSIGAGMGTSLMSVDAEKVILTILALQEILSAIAILVVALVILWHAIGISFLATLIAALASLALCPLVARGIGSVQAVWSAKTDEYVHVRNDAIQANLISNVRRIRLIVSVLKGMKQIKMSAYEDVAMEKIEQTREVELNAQRAWFRGILRIASAMNYVKGIMNLATLVTFYLVTRGSDRFNVTTVFTVLATVQTLADPLNQFGQNLGSMLAAWSSLKRIQTFLCEKERHIDQLSSKIVENAVSSQKVEEEATTEEKPQSDSVVRFENVTLAYGDYVTLSSLQLSIKKGSLTMVIGSVGSGKSTLLKSFAGEIEKIDGKWSLPTGQIIGLVTQDGWLQSGQSIRSNICFLSEFDRAWYNQVIQATALDTDFRNMPHGDHDLAQGLSGGQIQRICLARAIYSKASVYLLDDCFSALDAHTEAHIFGALFGPDGLLIEQTCVLATNSVHRLSQADHIITLSEATVCEQGSLAYLMQFGAHTKDLVDRFGLQEKEQVGLSLRKTNKEPLTGAASIAASKEADLVAMEMVSKYWHGSPLLAFARGASIWRTILVLVTTVSCFSMSGLTPLYTSVWTENDPRSVRYLIGYVGMELTYMVAFVLALYATMILWNLRGSRVLHRKLIKSILATGLTFFEDTPLGTILNRFSQDMNSCDMQFTMHFYNTLYSSVAVVLAAILIIVATYYTIPVIFVACVAFVLTQRFYVRSSVQLRKLALAAKSPMYTHFGEAIDPNGLVTIRAFKGEPKLIEYNTDLATESQTPFYLMYAVKRWLSIVLNLVVALINTSLVFLAIGERHSTKVGVFAVALQQGVSLTANMEQAFSSYSEFEIEAASITRIMQFGSLPVEEQASTVDRPAKDKAHPLQSGSISFHNVTLRYRPNANPALHGMNLQIKDGTRIAFVGRTGSGKSTTLTALLRLREIDSDGSIFIDGTAISSMSLKELRSQIAIIPQDPLLLDLTLRENLDLEGSKSDEQIWQALELCGAKDFVSLLTSKLDTRVSSDGSAFSRGQRQLLALTRVVLSPRKIICLDEASSSVDVDTDARIQRAIRQAFEGRTVLCVAHRLATIIDYDVICVLQAGKIIEQGAPRDLLARDGAFSSLAREQGLSA